MSWEIIAQILGTGAVIELVRWFVSRRQAQKKDDREDNDQEFTIAFKIEENAAIRVRESEQRAIEREKKQSDEFEIKLNGMHQSMQKEIDRLQTDLTTYRQNYYDILAKYTAVNQQYIIVVSTLDNLMQWLRAKGIEVPFHIPIVIDNTETKSNAEK